MSLLLSNDDSVHAQGLNALYLALKKRNKVIVVAPDRNHSGASHALSLEDPLRMQVLKNGFVAVSGTPTDCVHLALNVICKEKPQMVVSGINHGANMGDDVLYSGTVAAAMEGRFLGLPAMAISLAGKEHFASAAFYAQLLVEKLLHHALDADQVLNVNVPDLPLDKIKGIKVTRLGKRHQAEMCAESKDPRGRKIFWVGPPGKIADAGEGTDFHAINQGYVSITPLKIDLTATEQLAPLADWLATSN
ncbi:stationary-phase survival protein SurE [Psychromonas sp. CNPT3]|uniref:5'/3'-nucleotidase SurE n=1 Tax=Psychromonas sp. CNPT3 TaxID=314282 RepID=UPI00006E584C|nr:5'/3'-nucleotidase SurE [Psychromonas sp. CNPT3]AGH81945.1 stationary-phase survival protein SurE [Psychromonas sp. CNPT3]